MGQERYPKGQYTGIGFAAGVPLGAAMGLVMGNIAIGTAIGAALAIPIGIALERKYNPNPRPLTVEERRIRKRNLAIAFGVLMITFIAGIVTFFHFD